MHRERLAPTHPARRPTGLRRLTPNLLRTDRAAGDFAGLPQGVESHWQLLAAFKAAAPALPAPAPVGSRPPRAVRTASTASAPSSPTARTLAASPARAVWDGNLQAFNVGLLRQVMVTRGFTAETLQLAAGVGRGTIYNVLAGRRVRLSTARQILEVLATTPPLFLISSFTAESV